MAKKDGIIDKDTGPTFILRGRIVTMCRENDVIEQGKIVISKGQIVKVLAANAPVPSPYASALEIDTGGTIYPGLIDLHSHFVYNVLPLWKVPLRYDNRSQWPDHVEYKQNVSKPIKEVLAKYSESAKAIVRYVEAKALIAGTTTGQGMRTRVEGGERLFRGVMRNVEEPGDPRLPGSRTRVPNLSMSGSDSGKKKRAEFLAALKDTESRGSGYFYHLAEGVDDSAHSHFRNLEREKLIRSSLVAIHSLGLKAEDMKVLANKRSKVVWSPFSNLLLYGETLNLPALKDSGVNFSIGCDWSPTGSKNLLQELKVANFENARQGNVFSEFELVQGVTSNAAISAGWNEHLGAICDNFMADLLVIEGQGGNPYKRLIEATEKDVKLVMIDGQARYGDKTIVRQLAGKQIDKLEDLEVEGLEGTFNLYDPNSPINYVSFKDAVDVLERVMSNLPKYLQKVQEQKKKAQEQKKQRRTAEITILSVDQPEEFALFLDNEFEDAEDFLTSYEGGYLRVETLASSDVKIADSIKMDGVIVDTSEYWELLEGENNIRNELKLYLKNSYVN